MKLLTSLLDKMLDVYILFLLICPTFGRFPIIDNKGDNDGVSCLDDLIKKYFLKNNEITFVDVTNSGDDNMLKSLNMNMHISIISRTLTSKRTFFNQGYLVYAKTAKNLTKHFKILAHDANWSPDAKFVILIKSIDEKLYDVFNIFLKYHVLNVIMVNITADPDLYAYNPYENYGCGKRFDEIYYYGKCSSPIVDDLFPEKLITGLNNCTINIGASHWPPYSIDPEANVSKLLGIEEYMFKIISEREHFQINYRYTNDAENFTIIAEDMSAVGPLVLLQRNEVDAIFGGMILIKSRADAFNYIWSHLAFTDELRIMVKKADFVLKWKYVYLEFKPIVWILIVISFIVYSLFFILVLRVKDRSSIVLLMWDSLLSHGHFIHSNRAVKCAFVVWVLFAYLVNSFYQSSLFSLSTNPVREYQISSEEDLIAYNMKPCVSSVIRTFLLAEGMQPYENGSIECESHNKSIKMVCKREDLFTIVLYNVYLYNKRDFYDMWGRPLVYSFSRMSNIIYAVYFYKGFPLRQRFHMHGLRMRESGLLDHVTKDLHYEQAKNHKFLKKPLTFSIVRPWFVYIFGVCVAIVVFGLEIVIYSLNKSI